MSANSEWMWTGADPADVDDPLNFELIGGPGNASDITVAGTTYGIPMAGDGVSANDATLALPLDYTFNGITFNLTGTSEMSFVGTQAVGNGAGISYQNPTVDSTSLISNDPIPPAALTLNFAGYNVNDGTLISNGGPGSSITINVTQNAAAPGYLINYGDIEADRGNTVTIAAVDTSELFNAGLIYANGGTVIINGDDGIAGGAAPMLGGVALIGDGGSLEWNVGFPSGTTGGSPTFAFYDGDSGDTLMLLQPGQFGGRILDFQQGDTIDLGSGLAIAKIDVAADGLVSLENNRGAVIDTLVLSSGAYNTGTFTFTSAGAGTLVADGFTLTTAGSTAGPADGDTLLTTDVVNSVWNNSSGVWQNASDWLTGGVPGSSPPATVVIGEDTTGATGTISPFILTTGSSPVDVNSLTEINANATLQITSATTVGNTTNQYGISQIAGEIEVTGGNTLTSTFLQQLSPTADLQIDPGGILAITGQSDLGFANNGTIVANGNTIGLFVQGTANVDDGVINAGPVFSGISVVSTGGFISIGQDGGATPAAMTVENGGTVTDTYALLGSDPTSFGSLTLTGSGTTWNDVGDPTNSNFPGGMIVGDDDQASNGPSPLPSGTAQLVVDESATLNEATYVEIGATADSAGSATIETDGVWNIGTAGTGTLDVGVAGSGTLTVQSGGVLELIGSGSFEIGQDTGGDGTVTVNDGTLNAGSDNVVLGNASDSIGALTVDNDGLLVAGSISVGVDGTGSLTVDSGGTVESTGVTVGSGSTINLSGGVLDSAITVDSGGTIGGGGTAGAVTVDSGGTFAPGDPSTLTVASLTLASGATFDEQIGGTNPGTGGAGGYDQTVVESGGAISLGGATLDVSLVDGFAPTVGESFIIIDNETGSSVSGTFNGLANGAIVNLDGDPFQISYDGGANAQDVTLTATPPAITAIAENPASGEIDLGTAVTFTLTTDDPVTVDTANGAPTLSLNDNGTATYDAAASTSTSLVFDYTLSGTDIANVTSLQATLFNLDDAVIENNTGTAADISLTGLSQSGPAVDLPQLTGGFASPSSGTFGAGETMALFIEFNKAVTVTGNDITLSLNDGGTATLDAADTALLQQSGYAVFDYQVAPTDHDVSSLAVTGVDLNGGAIVDSLGDEAQFSALPTFNNVEIDTGIACYCGGTLIEVACGQKSVETLQIGDKVRTASGTLRPIKWIGRRSYGGRFVMGRKDILPVCIKAGALGDNMPKRDLWISPNHAMYLSGVLIEAKDLVNGGSIVQAQSVEKVEYFHIELETHDVIIAEGALSETFIDDDSRGMFHNTHEYRLLYPDALPGVVAQYCAPRLEDGYEVEAARRRIALRAGLLSSPDEPSIGTLRGFIDLISPHCIAGWAQNIDHPEAPVCLDVYVGDKLIGQVLANRYREDLKQAGLGSGRHSFEFAPPVGLGFAPVAVEVRRGLDGSALKLSAGAQVATAVRPHSRARTKVWRKRVA